MKTQPLALFLALGLFASAATAASVSLPEITLTDGRTLRDVSVKSYDAATGKFHLVADGTAQLVPAQLFSPALSADL